MSLPLVYYKTEQVSKLGDVSRFRIRFTNADPARKRIYLRIKNMENTSLRAIHLLSGPLVLYCHILPHAYSHSKRFQPSDPQVNKEVHFRNSVKPGQTFNVALEMNENSLIETSEDGHEIYEWECDVVCQIVLNTRASVKFVLMIGDDLMTMKRLNRSPLTALSKGDFASVELEAYPIELGVPVHPGLSVEHLTTDKIWKVEQKHEKMPVHLVILTHGLFSNLTADMLYLRDRIANSDADNYIVAGFRGNAGKTERGIHRLGVAISAYIVLLIDELQIKKVRVRRISFIGHSLGGPVQLYAIKHILQWKGEDYFAKLGIEPTHFICLASPMLGILSEMSLWISWFLNLGTLGKTGRDLALLRQIPKIHLNLGSKETYRPILETLPDDMTIAFLKKFDLRTVYANAINDGIVPLRTSALLYLDWQALGNVEALKANNSHSQSVVKTEDQNANALSEDNEEDVGEIPRDVSNDISKSSRSFLSSLAFVDDRKSKRLKKKIKKYSKISARGHDLLSIEIDDVDDTSEAPTEATQLQVPPKTSAVESALNTVICPVPSGSYIVDPDSRDKVILHDQYYSFRGSPSQDGHNVSGFRKVLNYNEWRIEKQVSIARRYHNDLTWRKILVCLPPDAHNNIVVRRRFANGFGWGVIDHLTENFFQTQKIRAKI